MAFWFAKSDSHNAQVVLLGIPLDATATFIPGTRFGSTQIRAYAESVESYSPYFKQDLADLKICDTGDVVLEGLPDMETKLEMIRKTTLECTKDGIKPVLIGGEHTLTLATVQAAYELYPDLVVLQLDAHADMRNVGESGKKIAHDTVMRRVMELLKPKSLIQVGLRSFAKEEVDVPGVSRFCIDDTGTIRDAINNRNTWLTVDLDVLDPSIMPAVGTPEPNGATYRQMIDLLLGLRDVNFAGADLVEFNPLAANFPAPAVTAANLLREMILLISGA